MLVCFLIIMTLCIIGDFVLEKFLHQKETEKLKMLSKSISKNILDTERQSENLLSVALKYVIDGAKRGYINNNSDLVRLKEYLSVSSINFYDKDGKMVFTSRELTPQLVEHYKTFSIFDKTNCPDYKLMQTGKENFKLLPFQWNSIRKISTKVASSWIPSLNQYISCTLDSSEIDQVLKNNINFYSDLQFLGIYAPSGQFLSYASRHNDNFSTEDTITQYQDSPQISSDKNISVNFSFGGLQKEICEANGRGLTNKEGEYFYNIKLIFFKTALNKQLFFSRIVFTTIAILSLLISYLITHTFYTRKQFHESLKLQAQQVHHDIANPIQALDWIISGLVKDKTITEDKLVKLKAEIDLIKGIIHDLYYLHDNDISKENLRGSMQPELLYPILDSVVISSKIAAGKSRQLVFNKPENAFTVVKVSTVELRRSLLNLIKNAILATHQDGVIKISLTQKKGNAIITIEDNGTGIADDTLDALNSGKLIKNSKTGKGMGFRYAKHIIKQMNGKIDLQTQLNKGTAQIITLPLAQEIPTWFINEMNLNKYSKIVILDDDEGIQSVYGDLLKGHHKSLIQFNNIRDFEGFMNSYNIERVLFLIDYAIDNIIPSGADLIKKYSLTHHAILVTHMYLESFVKDKSLQYGIKLLPKILLPFCKIS